MQHTQEQFQTQDQVLQGQGAGLVPSSNNSFNENLQHISILSSPENLNEKPKNSNESIYFKLYELFIEKFQIKFCPIRLGPYSKVPIDTGWTDQNYNPTPISWGRHNGNIGIIPGRSGLIIIDCDTQETIEFFIELANKINLNLDTLTIKTRRGIHYYYYCPFSTVLEKKQFVDQNRNIKIDILAGCKCQVVAPYSQLKLDAEGNILKKDAEEFTLFIYEPIHIPEKLPEITPDLYNLLINELEKTLQKTKEKTQTTRTTTTTNGEERELTDEEIEKITEALSEYFVEGQRQKIILFFVGFLRRDLNVSIESIYRLYQRLEPIDDPHDVKKRYEAIDRTFKKDVDEIAGRKELARILGKEKRNELCDKIKQILNIPTEKPKTKDTKETPDDDDFLNLLTPQTEEEEEKEPEKALYIEVSPKQKRFVRCNFDKLCMEYVQKRRDERTKKEYWEVIHTIFDCCIDEINVIKNPITGEQKYEIRFVSKNPVEKSITLKGTPQEIWEELKSKTSYVLNASIATNVLNLVISDYLKKMKFEEKEEDLGSVLLIV